MTEEPQSAERKVWTGRHVEIALRYVDGTVEQLRLDIVADAAADFDAGFLGESTPLAKALMGKTAGSVIAYRAGDIVEVRVLAVSADLRAAPSDLSQRRESVIRKALRDSDHTSLVMYASAMNNKWGDYDPGALKNDEEDEE
jgi:hypothetical protein